MSTAIRDDYLEKLIESWKKEASCSFRIVSGSAPGGCAGSYRITQTTHDP